MQRVNIVQNPFLENEKKEEISSEYVNMSQLIHIFRTRYYFPFCFAYYPGNRETHFCFPFFGLRLYIVMPEPMRTHIIKYTLCVSVCCLCVYAMHTHSNNLKTDRMDWAATKSGLYFHISQDQLLN